MTVSDMAIEDGSLLAVADTAPNVRVSTRARARIASTERDRKIPGVGAVAAVKAAVVDTATTVRSDLAGSWLLHNHLPSIAQLWARRVPAKTAIPGNCETPASHAMWVAETCWRTAAVALFTPLVAAMWLLHRAVTGVPTVLIGAALVAMWHINSGGGPR